MNTSELVRVSMVRFAASFLVILTTGILNRLVMTEFGVPALLATVVFSFQHLSSPLAIWSGYLSDLRPIAGRRRTPYILIWTFIAAAALPALPDLLASLDSGAAIVLSAILLAVMGFGLKAANLLVSALIVDRSADAELRGRQLNLVWIMAIAGFIVAGIVFGWAIPDFEPDMAASVDRLRLVAYFTPLGVVVVTALAVIGIEPRESTPVAQSAPRPRLLDALRAATRLGATDPFVRRTLIFLALSDFAFFIQEFVLEPYGADVFGLPVSVTTSFNITFGAGMVLAMVASGGLGILNGRFPAREVLRWANGLGAAAFVVLTFAGATGSALIPVLAIFVLGAAKGLYNTGLSHRFTTLARPEVAGVVMGAWGAVGGFAMALGGLAGGAIMEGAAGLGASMTISYSAVFAVEALLLLLGVRLLAPEEEAG